MLARYVLVDLVRNPRRTLSSVVGVTLGVGLFCGVLFFVDGLSASMTQRAVAPLAIDMQRIVTEPGGTTVTLTQSVQPTAALGSRAMASVVMVVSNVGAVDAHEVTVRSQPADGFTFVPGTATLDEAPITTAGDNPLSHGPGQTGLNLGTVKAGSSHRIEYNATAATAVDFGPTSVRSTLSTRENVEPVPANRTASVDLGQLVDRLASIDGVAAATSLSIADLGPGTLSHRGASTPGQVKVFGFDAGYAARDATIRIVEGALTSEGAVVSVEAAAELHLAVGDSVSLTLPDASTTELTVTGLADLSRSRALFSSRRGGDLETFLYVADSVVVSPSVFATTVQPAFDRAIAAGDGRLKNPPIREVDVAVHRDRLDADPAKALTETTRIAAEVRAIEAGTGDYVLDNISNTLAVADADASVAKRLFLFLGVPGGLLAAMIAAYAGTVLAEAQRREQATLRIRGASRRHLLRMLALRTGLITAVGSIGGLVSGYLVAGAFLGRESLGRANPASIVASAIVGTGSGFLATGLALYVTGRRSIDREINEDRARLAARVPIWRRARLDLIGAGLVTLLTVVAVRADAFAGGAGSVYFGRSVKLDVNLLILPVLAWFVGSLLAARGVAGALRRTDPISADALIRPLSGLTRRSMSRRPWAIGNATIIIALIVTLATSLATFTASYDAAKRADGRYANGADIRITPSPTLDTPYTIAGSTALVTAGVGAVSPVIFAPSNVILRSARTSDPTNVAAIDPVTFPRVAPVEGVSFAGPSNAAITSEAALRSLRDDPTSILLSRDMAAFLKAKVGDTIHALLARATTAQVEVTLHVGGLYERVPGFPEGADALMSIGTYVNAVPTKHPDFFLAAADSASDAGLQRAVGALRERIPSDRAQIETRVTTLAADQSSLAALNLAGLIDLDSAFSLAMTVATVGIFVFGLLLQRRREYVTLRAQGLEPRRIRLLILFEASFVAIAGTLTGIVVGLVMGTYFVAVLRPLFVLRPAVSIPAGGLAQPAVLILVATVVATLAASSLVNRLEPTELLRDE